MQTNSRKKGLLIAPEFPRDAFWSYRYILHFINRKASFPPVGLLTFAAQLPDDWDFELLDFNVRRPGSRALRRRIAAADAVFVSAMSIQKATLVELLSGPAVGTGTPWILGGALASTYRDQIMSPTTPSDEILHRGLDLIVWGESHPWIERLSRFLEQHPRHSDGAPVLLLPDRVATADREGDDAYLSDRALFRQLEDTPPPRWDLINVADYRALMLQTTVGCPFRCEFCDIVRFNGGFSRAKSSGAVLRELQAIYDTGHRGSVFTVDDNFIGNPKAISRILDEIIQFQRQRDYPFNFYTQASVNVGTPHQEYLITKMKQAGFDAVFLGIENPDPEALKAMNKGQNNLVDLPEVVRKLQHAGIEVYAGFIFGCDNDCPDTARSIVEFVRETDIVSAMTGMLTPLPHTPLYERLRQEGRLLKTEFTGNNTDDDIQFMPKRMSLEEMRNGVRYILDSLFDCRDFYRRAGRFLKNYEPHIFIGGNFAVCANLKAACLSVWNQGIKPLDPHYFRFLLNAFRLDRQYVRLVRRKAREFRTMCRDLGNRNVVILDEARRQRFQEILGEVGDYLVRCRPDMSLQQVSEYVGTLRARIAAGSLPVADAQRLYADARAMLRRRRRQFRFPGSHLVFAFELAVKAIHYEKVKNAILSRT